MTKVMFPKRRGQLGQPWPVANCGRFSSAGQKNFVGTLSTVAPSASTRPATAGLGSGDCPAEPILSLRNASRYWHLGKVLYEKNRLRKCF
jgi:hypothetical protein